jgi:hypothetical protein
MQDRHWFSKIIRCVEPDYRNWDYMVRYDRIVGKTVGNGWIGGKFNHLRDERYQAHIYCTGKHNENGRL